jgi:hypothetical protein
MPTKLLAPVYACLLFATACNEKSPLGPTVAVDQQFTLAPGQTASIEGTSVRVQFLRVSGDSRCPADALCVWAGDATVHVRATDSGVGQYELHAGDASRSVVAHGDFRIGLVQLQPYPFSGRTIEPGDYRVILTVNR